MQLYKTRRIPVFKCETVTLCLTDNTDNRCLAMITVITTKNMYSSNTDADYFEFYIELFKKKAHFLAV